MSEGGGALLSSPEDAEEGLERGDGVRENREGEVVGSGTFAASRLPGVIFDVPCSQL